MNSVDDVVETNIPWLPKVPSDWKVSQLKFEASIKARVGWQNLRSDEFIDSGPFCITGTDFKDGEIDWSSAYHVSEDRYEVDLNIQLKEGDLLITKDGTIGKVAVISSLPGPACLNSGIFVVRPKSGSYESRFLYWLLCSKVFKTFIDLFSNGSTINHLYQNVFERFKFPTPEIQTQRLISDFLDHQTERIDALITEKHNFIDLLKEKRQALISHFVTKGLDANVPMKESGIEWIGEVPAHWSCERLKRKVAIQGGYAFSSDDLGTEGVNVIRIGNINRDGSIDIDACKKYPFDNSKKLEQFQVRNGDMLMAMTGATIGKIGWYKEKNSSLLNQRVGAFRIFEDALDQRFLWYVLQSKGYQEHVKLVAFGGAQPNISDSGILSYRYALPKYHEQSQIVHFLDENIAQIDTLISERQVFIALLKEKRQALISAAVTGKIDVRNYNKTEAI